jgi:hypothetical protein
MIKLHIVTAEPDETARALMADEPARRELQRLYARAVAAHVAELVKTVAPSNVVALRR